jgi:hypothetical protein
MNIQHAEQSNVMEHIDINFTYLSSSLQSEHNFNTRSLYSVRHLAFVSASVWYVCFMDFLALIDVSLF